MKDSEARERIEALETAIAGLPRVVGDALSEDLAPLIKRFNQAIEHFNTVADQLERMQAQAADNAKALVAQAELLEIMESDHNAMRVDVNSALASVNHANSVMSDIVTAFQGVKLGDR